MKPGDEILVPDHTYQACWNTVDFITKRAGAKTVVAPLSLPIENPEQVTKTILNHTTEKTKILDFAVFFVFLCLLVAR